MAKIDETKVQAFITAADTRYVKQVAGKQLSTNDFTNEEKTKLAGLFNTIVDGALSTTSENPVQNKVVQNALNLKANYSDLATVAMSGSYRDLTNLPTLSDFGGEVTVEKQSVAENGFLSTYVIKQDGSQVGVKINVPKDFLLKSATMGTVSVENTPVEGYNIGDKFLDFVVNTAEDDEVEQHIYVNVKDLIDTYIADETSLTLDDNNQFSIKTGGIRKELLEAGIQISLDYADEWSTSLAKNITSEDIDNWNGKSELTIAEVEDVVESYFNAITDALGE